MDLQDIEFKLNELFSSSDYRQIVMWFDANQEFIEDINNLTLNNVEIFRLTENNWIYAKYYMESLNSNTNFLVYAPFSQPADEDNYLADMCHYATKFSADKLSIIAEEIGIPMGFKDIMEQYSSFWNSKARKDAFNALNIKEYNKDNIILGILCVLSNEKTFNFDNVTRKIILESITNVGKENKILDSFKKFNVLNEFWSLVSNNFSFTEEKPTMNKFLIFLILNYSASLFDGNVPSAWMNFLITDKNNSRVFMDNFMNNSNYSDKYDEFADYLENRIDVSKQIGDLEVESYINCDSFKIFDKNIIRHYTNLLFETETPIEFDNILRNRRKTHFFKYFEDEYELLIYANEFIRLNKQFSNDLIPEDAIQIVENFTNKWVYMDTYYRKFYYHYDRIENKEYLNDLRSLIENMYKNTFLNKITGAFTNNLISLEEIPIKKQWNFYKQNINNSYQKHKTAVIISDAFRYGCAVELQQELEKDPKRTCTMEPMLSTVPSYTRLGMASLLPHHEISYVGGDVLVDGMKCSNSQERENILQKYNPDSIVMTFDDLNKSTGEEFKEKVKGKNLIYVYHNQIDARGDNAKTEDEVFKAAQESVDEIIRTIKKLRDSGNYATIYVVADHGFIYKRDKIQESGKIDIESMAAIYKNKRFILTDYETDIPGTICFSLDYIGNPNVFVTVAKGADIFKLGGAGQNFVHGGASLQEIIVPLLKVEAKKGAKNQQYVELELMSNKKINNHNFMLTFFQKENVGIDIIPLDALIYFVDSEDNKISNMVPINANINSPNAVDREFKEHFALKDDIQYDKSNEYYLIIKNLNTDFVEKIPFVIDIAFQDGFDFF